MRESVKEMAVKGYSLDRMVTERRKQLTAEIEAMGISRDDSVRWRQAWRQKFKDEARKFGEKVSTGKTG